MNKKEFLIELVRNDMTIPKLAELLSISKKALYEKFNGKTQFKQDELSKIIDIWNLSSERLNEIFFCKKVS